MHEPLYWNIDLSVLFFYIFTAGTAAAQGGRSVRYTEYSWGSDNPHQDRICSPSGALSHARRAVPRGLYL